MAIPKSSVKEPKGAGEYLKSHHRCGLHIFIFEFSLQISSDVNSPFHHMVEYHSQLKVLGEGSTYLPTVFIKPLSK